MTRTMTKDQAVDIAYGAENMTLTDLLAVYAQFHEIVENTPDWIKTKDTKFQRGLHAAVGLSTEAGEIMDAFKKELYGKNKPLRPDNIREEAGDVFFYLFLLMRAYELSLRDIIKDNVVKLANRYIEKFDA